MLKPTASYRMKKSDKTLLTQIKDPQLRSSVKRSIIAADLNAAIQPKRDKSPGNFKPSSTPPAAA